MDENGAATQSSRLTLLPFSSQPTSYFSITCLSKQRGSRWYDPMLRTLTFVWDHRTSLEHPQHAAHISLVSPQSSSAFLVSVFDSLEACQQLPHRICPSTDFVFFLFFTVRVELYTEENKEEGPFSSCPTEAK